MYESNSMVITHKSQVKNVEEKCLLEEAMNGCQLNLLWYGILGSYTQILLNVY